MAGRIVHDGREWTAEADPIDLAPPDPAWARAFDAEARALRHVLRHVLPASLRYEIEHIGSTAVPGLPAKPIIDILLILPDRDRWPDLIEPIESLGYSFWRENPDPNRQFYVKGMPPFGERRTHHIHTFLPGDAEPRIRFRDLLRRDAEVARRYLALKERLAASHRLDREAYTEGKTEFIRAALLI